MNKNLKCILIDLDGTIINSGPDLIDSLNHALKNQNFHNIEEQVVGSLVGGGAKAMIEKALEHMKKTASEDQIELMVSNFLEFYFKNCSKKSRLYSNVILTLKFLKQNFRIGLCTNKKQNLTEKIVEDFKIKKYFDFILGSRPDIPLKPETDMLSFSIEKLGFKPENSIMVGDSDNDIIPAQKLGMKSIFVTYGYGKVNNLINPNYLIDDFKEIIEIVKN